MLSTLRNILVAGILLLSYTSCQTEKPRARIDLSKDWQFKALDSTRWLSASIPGVVHADLLAHKLIPDPFIKANEDSVQWIENIGWEYQTTFQLSNEDLNSGVVEIVFKGLDTYAEVSLNDYKILAANNMFREWRIDVKDKLIVGANKLRVVFTPPVAYNKKRVEELGYTLPAGSETGEWRVSPFTRKAGYQFGWDFAPRLVSMGIWKPVYLDLWNKTRINDVDLVANNISEQEAQYTAYVTLYCEKNTSSTVEVLENEKDVELTKGLNTVAVDFSIANPQLWWPNGLGEPKMYDIPITVSFGGNLIDSLNQKLGIRTIELVQEYDSLGRSFFFKVNDIEVFVKGANWSPLSSFPSEIPDSTYRNRLQLVKDANMNMLRVWGGGIYESDLFYDLCDERGIMVWQDFMFANSMYPGDDAFIDNVKEEVKEQVLRLRSHPSLALWNGNNEIDVGWKNWGWQKQYKYSIEDSTKISSDYDRLFQQDIPNVIDTYDSTTDYTHTSPLSNWGKPENFNIGSMHYWGVWHGKDSFEDYETNVGRFMAEYGFQSYPSLTTFKQYSANDNPSMKSIENDSHQKSYVGNGLILQQIDKYFGKPSGFDDFIEKSQLAQGIAMKTAIEAHRMNKTVCGGTLFWQLNDCWPGPSWSVIDYFGHKKIAYDIVKDRYKPIILVLETKENDFAISVVNDLFQEVEAELKLELFKVGNKRIWVSSKPISIQANTVQNIYRSDIRKILDGMPKEEVYLKASLILEDESVADIEKFYFLIPKDYKGKLDLIGHH